MNTVYLYIINQYYNNNIINTCVYMAYEQAVIGMIAPTSAYSIIS